MPDQIIKQPDGKFAVWSTVVDDFTILGATVDELAEYYGRKAYAAATGSVRDVIRELDNNEKPYYQFIMTWEEANELRDSRHE